MEASPFETRWVEVSVDNGPGELRCLTCGAHVLKPEEGLAESLCNHVVFIEDWVGELSHTRPDVTAALNNAYSSENDGYNARRGAILDCLPSNSFVLELVEPGRGGGHDGSSLIVGFEIPSLRE